MQAQKASNQGNAQANGAAAPPKEPKGKDSEAFAASADKAKSEQPPQANAPEKAPANNPETAPANNNAPPQNPAAEKPANAPDKAAANGNASQPQQAEAAPAAGEAQAPENKPQTGPSAQNNASPTATNDQAGVNSSANAAESSAASAPAPATAPATANEPTAQANAGRVAANNQAQNDQTQAADTGETEGKKPFYVPGMEKSETGAELEAGPPDSSLEAKLEPLEAQDGAAAFESSLSERGIDPSSLSDENKAILASRSELIDEILSGEDTSIEKISARAREAGIDISAVDDLKADDGTALSGIATDDGKIQLESSLNEYQDILKSTAIEEIADQTFQELAKNAEAEGQKLATSKANGFSEGDFGAEVAARIRGGGNEAYLDTLRSAETGDTTTVGGVEGEANVAPEIEMWNRVIALSGNKGIFPFDPNTNNGQPLQKAQKDYQAFLNDANSFLSGLSFWSNRNPNQNSAGINQALFPLAQDGLEDIRNFANSIEGTLQTARNVAIQQPNTAQNRQVVDYLVGVGRDLLRISGNGPANGSAPQFSSSLNNQLAIVGNQRNFGAVAQLGRDTAANLRNVGLRIIGSPPQLLTPPTTGGFAAGPTINVPAPGNRDKTGSIIGLTGKANPQPPNLTDLFVAGVSVVSAFLPGGAIVSGLSNAFTTAIQANDVINGNSPPDYEDSQFVQSTSVILRVEAANDQDATKFAQEAVKNERVSFQLAVEAQYGENGGARFEGRKDNRWQQDGGGFRSTIQDTGVDRNGKSVYNIRIIYEPPQRDRTTNPNDGTINSGMGAADLF